MHKVDRQQLDEERALPDTVITQLATKATIINVRQNKGKKKRWEDIIKEVHIELFAQIYATYFERTPYSGDESGPFNRYILACICPTLDKSDQSIPTSRNMYDRWYRSPLKDDPFGLSAFD